MLYPASIVPDFHAQTFGFLQVEEQGHVLRLTLNRPDKKNAIHPTLLRELAYALSYARHQPEVWAVMIAAAGDTFCAGYDLRSFAGAETGEGGSTIPEPPGDILLGELMVQVHKPTLALVQGPAYAGAFLLLCGCSQVFAVGGASFQLPEVKRGIWPMQVMASLLHLMPARQALDLCMRAPKLTAAQAAQYGIVTRVVEDAAALQQAGEQWVQEILEQSPTAIRLGLAAYDQLRAIAGPDQHAWLRTQLAAMLQSEDAREGLAAFAEKRKPNWTGR
jgi:enoyl-CoA hydratase/carnithine racemase